jgi:hypothetical protein
MLSVTLREEHRSREFENRVLRVIFKRKRKEGLHNLYASLDQIKENGLDL